MSSRQGICAFSVAYALLLGCNPDPSSDCEGPQDCPSGNTCDQGACRPVTPAAGQTLTVTRSGEVFHVSEPRGPQVAFGRCRTRPDRVPTENEATLAARPLALGAPRPVAPLSNSVMRGNRSQVRYVVDAVRTMRREGLGTVEPTPEAQATWTAEVQERMKPTVWTTGGCASWYLDKFGNNTTLWPGQTFTFRQRLAKFDLEAYDVTAEGPVAHTPSRSAEEALA